MAPKEIAMQAGATPINGLRELHRERALLMRESADLAVLALCPAIGLALTGLWFALGLGQGVVEALVLAG